AGQGRKESVLPHSNTLLGETIPPIIGRFWGDCTAELLPGAGFTPSVVVPGDPVMSRIAVSRSRMDSVARRCRPRLESLEARWVPSTTGQGAPVGPVAALLGGNGVQAQGATPPTLDAIEDQTLAPGEALHLQVSGHAAGGSEDLQYSLLVAPRG